MIRRVVSALLVLLALGSVHGLGAAEGWLTDLAAAKKAAKESGRPILVDFSGSDWCGWCIKLDKEVFSQEAFKAYAKDELVLLLVDFPRKTQLPAAEAEANDALAKQYKVEGFPTVILLDAEGAEIARTGYQKGGAEAYVTQLKTLLPARKDDKKGKTYDGKKEQK